MPGSLVRVHYMGSEVVRMTGKQKEQLRTVAAPCNVYCTQVGVLRSSVLRRTYLVFLPNMALSDWFNLWESPLSPPRPSVALRVNP